ncbi:GNAT family N-acetyltransferase [Metabacillus sp. HB246100]
MEIVIRRLTDQDPVPEKLLLEADPSSEHIKKYLKEGICFVAKERSTIIGVIVIIETSDSEVEIVNLAVTAAHRGKKIAKKLLTRAEEYARNINKECISIGTGNSSLNQLALYQKSGFRLDSIRKNYFRENYLISIFEDGIQCVDMIVLKKKVSKCETF